MVEVQNMILNLKVLLIQSILQKDNDIVQLRNT